MDEFIEDGNDRNSSSLKSKQTTVPEPIDTESFREALEMVLATANANQVAIANRSWKCEPSTVEQTYDVEIVLVEGGE